MRYFYSFIALLAPLSFAADEQRSIFQDNFGNGVSNDELRSGNIRFTDIPNILIAITNNLLSFVGYVSICVILMGALIYIFGGINEEAKSKGKSAIKVALWGAVVSWSGWFMVNFVLDNV